MFSLPLSHDDFKYGSVAPLTPFLLTVSVPPAPRPWDARLGLLTIWVSFQLLSSSPCDGREEFLQSNDVIGFLVIEAAFGSLRSYPPPILWPVAVWQCQGAQSQPFLLNLEAETYLCECACVCVAG